MRRLVLTVALLISACASRPAQRNVVPLNNSAPVWCFSGDVTVDDEVETGEGCFSSAKLCANARKTAIDYGGWAGIKAISACETRVQL